MSKLNQQTWHLHNMSACTLQFSYKFVLQNFFQSNTNSEDEHIYSFCNCSIISQV